jgi:phosphoglycerate dehydrogenase-like enzyme
MKLVIMTPGADDLARRIRAELPQLEIATPALDSLAQARREIEQADCLLAWRFPADLLRAAPRLRWVMSFGAGVDHLLQLEIPERVTITRIEDAFGPAMAEYVLAYCYAVRQDLRRVLEQQRAARWEPFGPIVLRESTAVVVGLGNIGREVCKLLGAAGLRVLGVSRSGQPVPEAEKVYPVTELRQALPAADFLVLVLPLTAESRGLVGPRELALLHADAWLINIARGPIVDEAALLVALEAGAIGGAVLDVFDQEPLPPEHPFWRLPNVIVTPHISGPDDNGILADQFVENYRRFAAGEPLLRQVDRARGY